MEWNRTESKYITEVFEYYVCVGEETLGHVLNSSCKMYFWLGTVAHAYNPSTLGG